MGIFSWLLGQKVASNNKKTKKVNNTKNIKAKQKYAQSKYKLELKELKGLEKCVYSLHKSRLIGATGEVSSCLKEIDNSSSPEVVAIAARLLRNKSWFLRSEAIKILSHRVHRDVICKECAEIIMQHLYDRDYFVQYEIVKALVEIGGVKGSEELERLMYATSRPDIKAKICEIRGWHNDQKEWERIASMSSDEERFK
jgi:hypothetical protein